MKELDFDELDRAVNSLMTKTDEPQQNKQGAPATQSDAPETAPQDSSDEDGATLSSTSESTGTSPSLATKRSGRFMDMMPASATTKTSRPVRPSHVGPILKPINDVVNPEPIKPSPEPGEQLPSSDTNETAKSEVDTATTQSWPDPIDLHEQTSATNEISEQEPDVSDDNTEAQAAELSAGSSAADSPFLSDAKVEKRPLDALTPINNVDTQAVSVETDVEAHTAPQAMPAELGEELLAIESDSHLTEESERGEAVKESVPEKKDTSVQEDTVPTTDPTTQTIDESQPKAVNGISINQQYKVAESTRDQSHAALYDNAAEPLQHPPKQKSTWPIILVILLLVLIGAGGAAALYFLKLI